MFGGNDNSQAQQVVDPASVPAQSVGATATQVAGDPTSPPPVALPEPIVSESAATEQSNSPTAADPEPTIQTVSPASATPQAPATVDELLDIKQDALQQLTPLLNHLDQSPEERFRTTMMMIQASDNDSLLKTAYEAAQQITDEKVRAQALLDVVNEINYFTQHNGADQPE